MPLLFPPKRVYIHNIYAGLFQDCFLKFYAFFDGLWLHFVQRQLDCRFPNCTWPFLNGACIFHTLRLSSITFVLDAAVFSFLSGLRTLPAYLNPVGCCVAGNFLSALRAKCGKFPLRSLKVSNLGSSHACSLVGSRGTLRVEPDLNEKPSRPTTPGASAAVKPTEPAVKSTWMK
jgi:hypothetical protein